MKNKIIIFENKEIRRYWDNEKELWYFSVIDIIRVLTQSDRPRKYWDDLKRKLKDEGSQLSEKIGQLKMQLSVITKNNFLPNRQIKKELKNEIKQN
jgi:hypothetical protein